ncbi:hypothetical protein AB0F43_14395 [Kribbella sp. NPDC023972]|uniref:hypothetical protein n=1 Tax=Kribbella sp. NPDC023972 TaxID=3154795 RepID=UPI0033E15420
MTNPSEGPGPSDALREALGRREFSEEQVNVFMAFAEHQREFYEQQLALNAQQQARLEALQQQVDAQAGGGRARRAAPYVGTAAAAAAVASDQGQAVIGDVGRWTGDQATAFGQYAAEQYTAARDGLQQFGQDVAREASERYNAAVDGLQQFGQDVAREASERYNAAVDGLQQFGQDVAREAGERYDAAVQGAQEAISTASGWAVQTWGVATDAAHAVGGWASQYADAVAANPGNYATTAALAAGAVVAATPQLRKAVGQAANATSRWAKAGWEAVRNAPANARQFVAQNVKQMYDAVRSDPRVMVAMAAVRITPRQMHEGANEVTSPESKLPKSQEMVAATLANDPSRPAPSTTIKVEQNSETQATGTGAGEAAATQRTTNPSERGKGGIGKG